MAAAKFQYYVNQFQQPPKARNWWPKALVISALLGGIYGASLESAIGAAPGAAGIIEIAAVDGHWGDEWAGSHACQRQRGCRGCNFSERGQRPRGVSPLGKNAPRLKVPP